MRAFSSAATTASGRAGVAISISAIGRPSSASRTQPPTKRATIPAYIRLFHALRLGTFKRADLVYELRNGAKVYFGSCDNPESLEGLHVRAARNLRA